MTMKSRGGVIDLDRLRIHFYVNYSSPTGTYFRFHNLAVGLTRLGHEVTVFAGDLDYRSRPRREVRDGVPYQIIPETFLVRLFGVHCDPIGWARRYARRYPPCDVAHLFQPFPCAAAAWVRTAARVKFYDWDDLWSGGLIRGAVVRWRDYWPRALIRIMEGRLPALADHVTAISRFLADMARERGARSVTLLHSGSWPAEPLDRSAIRARLGLRTDSIYAGFMGRTTAELSWCFDALARNIDRFPALRLALCGMRESELDGLEPAVRGRIDYLGQLTATEAKQFAACLDLALLPMKEDNFNLSRLPQKFGDHVAAGAPLLCSTIGECALLAPRFPWVIPAGRTHGDWLGAFDAALDRVSQGDLPAFDPCVFRENLSWEGLSRTLAQTYRAALTGRPSCRGANDPLELTTVGSHATD